MLLPMTTIPGPSPMLDYSCALVDEARFQRSAQVDSDLGGSQSSIRLPSGSMIQANRPYS